MAKPTIKIKLTRSTINRPKAQKAVVAGLGLRRLNQTVERPNTREIRGMINKIPHLLEVKELD